MMKNPLQSPIAITAAALLALAFGAQASAASPDDDKSFRKQAKACIAEIGAQIDYGRASRAKHAVISTGQTLEGQSTLQIETSLISGRRDKVIKRYSTSCVIGESATVAKLDIAEIDAAAPATSIAHSK
jgi:hypothetical protein